MNVEKLKQAMDYCDVFKIIANGTIEMEELDEKLRERATSPSALQRRRKWLSEDPAYLTIADGRLFFDVTALADDLSELRNTVIPEEYVSDGVKKLQKEIEIRDSQIAGLELKNKKYKQVLANQQQKIDELKAKILNQDKNFVKTELERKVLVASSISVGPQESIMDDCFLVDPNRLLDVDACVARYGGELDSFYKEIPTDEKNTGFEPGHELTERNHALRTMKTVGTKRFFLKRIKDNAEAKETEKRVGQLFPGHGDGKTEWQKERDKILHNRFMSLNNILKCDRLTNQEKLMMYAMNTEYHNTHIERLLNYAGSHCINANYVIELLEDPDICTTYENTIDFLNQFANPSEFRMKLNLARELIEGKWYITADYNGKETKFQLVPIDEINELRKAVGLPVSEFVYKGKKTKKFTRRDEDTEEEEENLKKPDFVENVNDDSYGDIDIPDDDFEMPDLEDDDTSF